MNHLNLDERWRLEEEYHIIYLTSETGRINILSKSTTCSVISMTITSCELPKKLIIRTNGELVFSGSINPNIFIKVIFRTLLLKGTNLLDFHLTSNGNFIQNEEDVYRLNDIIAIKDFIITSEVINRYL